MKNIALLLLFFPLTSFAGACDPIPGAKPETVVDYTNYAPKYSGINGHCGTSAREYDACKFFLEDHLAGKSNAVMAAVPQKGGTSYLFGGIYKGAALERSLGVQGGCVRVFVLDRFATQYKGKSINGKSKMDIVTRDKKSALTARVNNTTGELLPIGRAKIIRNKAKRKLARNVEAVGELPASLSESEMAANSRAINGYSPEEEFIPVPERRPTQSWDKPVDTQAQADSQSNAVNAAAAALPLAQQYEAQRKAKAAATANAVTTPVVDNRMPASTVSEKTPIEYHPRSVFWGTTSDDLDTRSKPAEKKQDIKIDLPENQ
jgi:hypothetical protein